MSHALQIEANDLPAVRVIKRFGGLAKAARALNRSKSTIQRWKQSGYIHPDYYREILEAALAEQVPLDPADFNVVDVKHPAFNVACSQVSGDTAGHDASASRRPIHETAQSLACVLPSDGGRQE